MRLAGTVDIDLNNEPLGTGSDGQPVYLKDLWPSQQEIAETIAVQCQGRDMFKAHMPMCSRLRHVEGDQSLWKVICMNGMRPQPIFIIRHTSRL